MKKRTHRLDTGCDRALALGCIGLMAMGLAFLWPGVAHGQEPERRLTAEAATHLALGEALQQQGDLTGALQEFQLAAAADPTSLYLKGRVAEVLLSQGKTEAALSSLEPYRDSEEPEVLRLLVTAYLKAGREEEALKVLKRLAELDPQDGRVRLQLAQELSRRGHYAEALQYYREATALLPDSPEFHLGMGQLLVELERLDEAQTEFLAARALSPQSPIPLQALGQLSERRERWSEALGYYFQALALEDYPEPVLDHLRELVPKLPSGEGAVRQLRTLAYDRHPDDIRFWAGLGVLAYQSRATPMAVEALGRAVELGSHDPATLFTLGRALLEQGRSREALPYFLYLTASQPQEYLGWANLALGYMNLGQTRPALEALGRAEALRPHSPELLDYKGRLRFRLEDYAGAKEAFLQSLERDSSNLDLRLRLALVYAELNEPEKAEAMLEEVLRRGGPGIERALSLYRGHLASRKKEYPRALVHYRAGLKLAAEDPQLLYAAAVAASEAGAGREAETYIRRLLQVDPEDADALNFLGYIYAEEGRRLKEAQRLIERALEQDPQNGAYLDSLAWVYYQRKEYSRALETMRKALLYSRDDPVLYEHLGAIYEELGDRQAAVEALRKALELDPGNPRIQTRLNRGSRR